jgi:hypothetical protein
MMVSSLYDELVPENRDRFEKHLESCPACSRLYHQLRSAATLMDKREQPDPGDAYWARFWDRLEPGLDRREAPRRSASQTKRMVRGIFPIPAWTIRAAGALAILALGIFIGRFILQERSTLLGRIPLTDTEPVASPPAELTSQTQRYLDRSKVLLLGLMNFDTKNQDPAVLNLGHQQQISRSLLNETATLKTGWEDTGNQRILGLISDLEVILMQIANLELQYDIEGIELVQSGVESRGILFKITINEMLRDSQPPDPSGGTGTESPSI